MKSLRSLWVALALAVTLLAGGGSVALAQTDNLPPAPTNLAAVNGANPGEVNLTWNAAPEAAFYRIGWVAFPDYEATIAAGRNWLEAFHFFDAENTGQTQWTLTRLSPGVQYYFIIGSASGRFQTARWSEWSNPMTLTQAPTDQVDYSAQYPNCDAVREHFPGGVKRGSPIYRADLDPDGDGLACEPSSTPTAPITYGKISLSDESNTRGYQLTVVGSGFNNGTTATIYVLSRIPSRGNECDDIVRNGTRVGSATVGSDGSVAVTFAVTAPPFNPGNQNYICMIDGQGRTSGTDVEQFTLETGGDGTKRSSPISYGQRFRAGVFDMQITAVDTDAWPEIEAENQFNDPPPRGKQFVMWTLTVWNVLGSYDESETITESDFELVGNQGVKYQTFEDGVICGVTPNDLSYEELYRGGTVTGTVCFAVPVSEIGGGLTLHYDDYQSTDELTGSVSVWFDALPD